MLIVGSFNKCNIVRWNPKNSQKHNILYGHPFMCISVVLPSNCVASLVTVDFLYNRGDCVKAKIPLADTCFFTLGPWGGVSTKTTFNNVYKQVAQTDAKTKIIY